MNKNRHQPTLQQTHSYASVATLAAIDCVSLCHCPGTSSAIQASMQVVAYTKSLETASYPGPLYLYVYYSIQLQILHYTRNYICHLIHDDFGWCY